MAYAHSLGPSGGTLLDFTDHDKWVVTDISDSIHARAEFAPNGPVGSFVLVDWDEEGSERALAVTCFGDYATCQAAMNELKDMADSANNRATSNGSLTPVDYIEVLADTALTETWEVVHAAWQRKYGLVIGGNAVDGLLTLRVKQD